MSEDLRGDLSGLGPRGQIVVGFSGGADSTALAHWLTGKVRRERIVLAHVNHMLRGEEADRDEAAARAFAQGQGLRFVVFRTDVKDLARQRGMGLEECGREVRYEFFLSLAQGEDDCVLTAHNADDNAETMLLHLCRGAGLSGLCGIPYQRGKILRPLLRVSRREIEDYCASQGLSYVTDSSNLCGTFARNRIRAEVIPIFRELNPRFIENMTRTAGLLCRDREFMREEAEKLLQRARGDHGLNAGLLRSASAPLLQAALKIWLENAGCGDLEKKHLDDAADCVLHGGAVSLPGGAAIRCRAGVLSVSRSGEEPPEGPAFSLPVGPGEWLLPGGKCLVLEKRRIKVENSTQKIHNLDFKNALDYDIITGNLTARSRREGDRFSPAGRGVSKPLKQVFREAGVPAEQRGSAVLLECEGRLAFCEGAGASEEFCVRKETKTALFVFVRGREA